MRINGFGGGFLGNFKAKQRISAAPVGNFEHFVKLSTGCRLIHLKSDQTTKKSTSTDVNSSYFKLIKLPILHNKQQVNSYAYQPQPFSPEQAYSRYTQQDQQAQPPEL